MGLFEFGNYWDTKTFIVYIIIGITLALLFKYGAKKNYISSVKAGAIKNRINIYYIVSFLILLFFYTFKDISVGADSPVYVKLFLQAKDLIRFNISDLAFFRQTEPLYLVLIYIIRKFTNNYTIYFAVVGVIISYGYIKFIRRFWYYGYENLFLVIFFGVAFSYDMNIQRSGLAISFMLQSLCYLDDKKVFKACVYSLVGTLFHYTMIVNFAYIAFFLILVNREKISRLKVLIFSGSCFVATVGLCYFMRSFLLDSKYGHYVTDGMPSLLGHWADILTIILAVYIILTQKHTDSKIYVPLTMGIFNIFVLVAAMLVSSYRITWYYFLPRLTLWGYGAKYLFRKNIENIIIRKIIVVCIIIFYALFVLGRRSQYIGFKYMFRKYM